MSSAAAPKCSKVLVTGAGGRTGKLVFEQLVKSRSGPLPSGRQRFAEVRGLLRKLTPELEEKYKSSPATLIKGDICDRESLRNAMTGVDGLVILTSAVPKVKEPRPESGPPQFYYEDGGMPEQVDWEGQKNQIDVAKEVGVKRIVMVGSRGGTEVENNLNKIGGGNILIWKRKAEQYLVDSGLAFTIIRAGGLLDKQGGKSKLVIGSDDEDLGFRTVPRQDVASTVVAALEMDSAVGKSMDLVAEVPQVETEAEFGSSPAIETDFIRLFEGAKAGM